MNTFLQRLDSTLSTVTAGDLAAVDRELDRLRAVRELIAQALAATPAAAPTDKATPPPPPLVPAASPSLNGKHSPAARAVPPANPPRGVGGSNSKGQCKHALPAARILADLPDGLRPIALARRLGIDPAQLRRSFAGHPWFRTVKHSLRESTVQLTDAGRVALSAQGASSTSGTSTPPTPLARG